MGDVAFFSVMKMTFTRMSVFVNGKGQFMWFTLSNVHISLHCRGQHFLRRLMLMDSQIPISGWQSSALPARLYQERSDVAALPPQTSLYCFQKPPITNFIILLLRWNSPSIGFPAAWWGLLMEPKRPGLSHCREFCFLNVSNYYLGLAWASKWWRVRHLQTLRSFVAQRGEWPQFERLFFRNIDQF